MRLLYHQKSIHNAGGIERILLEKAGRLAADGMDVIIVTTDSPREGDRQFFPIPQGVKVLHLDINYDRDADLSPIKRIISHYRKRRLHKNRLKDLLLQLRPDITITIYPTISSFIPGIKDGSKKWAELHFSRFFRRHAARTGLLGIIDRLRELSDKRILRHFDRVITLTQQDKTLWGEMPNMCVIPNFISIPEIKTTPSESKTVVAVGRLCRQKNFQLLLEAWSFVKRSPDTEGWMLEIYGDGPDRNALDALARRLNIQDSVSLTGNSENLNNKYAGAAMIVSTSLYEGLPLALAEGMAAGLPAISTDCESGPKDLINPEHNGILTGFNPEEIATAILRLIKAPSLRDKWGKAGKESIVASFSPEHIMEQWKNLITDF